MKRCVRTSLAASIPSVFRQALLNELVQDKTLTHTGGEYKLLGQAEAA